MEAFTFHVLQILSIIVKTYTADNFIQYHAGFQNPDVSK